MRCWVGRWIIFVGVVHCVFGAVIFFEPLSGIIPDGIWNVVDGYPGRPLAFWFEFLGLFTILFGAAIHRVEKETGEFPEFLSYGFLMLAILGIVTMPVGGGWLMIPGAVGLLLKKAKTPTRLGTWLNAALDRSLPHRHSGVALAYDISRILRPTRIVLFRLVGVQRHPPTCRRVVLH